MSWAWWPTPVVPATLEAEVGGSHEPQEMANHGATLPVLKIQKLAGRGGACL